MFGTGMISAASQRISQVPDALRRDRRIAVTD